MTLASQVKQHGSTIPYKLIVNLPLGLGIATNAVTIFNLKQGDGWGCIGTSRMEVTMFPTVNLSTEQKVSDNPLITQ